ncbi:hypothetical protein GCM10027346_41740 [Hymenobacter seoulensis]
MLAPSFFRLYLFALALAGCGAKQVPLTPVEEARLQALGVQLGSEVSLQYDYDAVTRHQPNGTVVLVVRWNVVSTREAPVCSADSLALQQQAAGLARKLVPQLRFAQHHQRIAIIFNATAPLGDNGFTQLCRRVVVASLRTKQVVFRNQQGII